MLVGGPCIRWAGGIRAGDATVLVVVTLGGEALHTMSLCFRVLWACRQGCVCGP